MSLPKLKFSLSANKKNKPNSHKNRALDSKLHASTNKTPNNLFGTIQENTSDIVEITGYGDKGAKTVSKDEKKKYIIPANKNRNYRQQIMKLRTDTRKSSNVPDEELKFGLNHIRISIDNESTNKESIKVNHSTNEMQNQTPEQQARSLLLSNGETTTSIAPIIKFPDELVYEHPMTENDAYKYDSLTRADATPDYSEIPVEEFGAAFLRGLGQEVDEKTTKLKKTEKRPSLLGLGAKAIGDVIPGLESVRGKDGKRKDNERNLVSVPAVRKNIRTGEIVTEEDFKELSKTKNRLSPPITSDNKHLKRRKFDESRQSNWYNERETSYDNDRRRNSDRPDYKNRDKHLHQQDKERYRHKDRSNGYARRTYKSDRDHERYRDSRHT